MGWGIIDCFNCDYVKMTEIFRKIIKPITKKEQEDFIKRIATKNSPVIKVYNSIKGPLFLIIGVLAGVHYGATKIDYGRYIYILILVIANIFAWEKAFNISIENM